MKRKYLLWGLGVYAIYIAWQFMKWKAVYPTYTIAQAFMNAPPLSIVRGGTWYGTAGGAK